MIRSIFGRALFISTVRWYGIYSSERAECEKNVLSRARFWCVRFFRRNGEISYVWALLLIFCTTVPNIRWHRVWRIRKCESSSCCRRRQAPQKGIFHWRNILEALSAAPRRSKSNILNFGILLYGAQNARARLVDISAMTGGAWCPLERWCFVCLCVCSTQPGGNEINQCTYATTKLTTTRIMSECIYEYIVDVCSRRTRTSHTHRDCPTANTHHRHKSLFEYIS